MTLEQKQESEWDIGTNNKVGTTYWQTVVVKNTDIIVCKVAGKTRQDAWDLAWLNIIDVHNNLL